MALGRNDIIPGTRFKSGSSIFCSACCRVATDVASSPHECDDTCLLLVMPVTLQLMHRLQQFVSPACTTTNVRLVQIQEFVNKYARATHECVNHVHICAPAATVGKVRGNKGTWLIKE